jgi:hypothetical protein
VRAAVFDDVPVEDLPVACDDGVPVAAVGFLYVDRFAEAALVDGDAARGR